MMKEISSKQISDVVRQLCIEANTVLPEDVCACIRNAKETETSPVGKSILGDLEENFTFAREKGLPICQDTGMAVVFLEIGQDVHVTGDINEAINDGVARGYVEGFLRLSVVADPLRRVNTQNNTPAIIHTKMVPGDKIRITVAPKGFGSENMTSLKMFNPSVSKEEIIQFIVDSVERAGSKPCPPVVIGIGLGGTSEMCALLAKKALMTPLGERNADPFYAEMEEEILTRVNNLGIGPQGLGGNTTALSASILTYGTHIAGLPCCVNLGCHVTRHACAEL